MNKFIQQLPKCELHLHIEGTLEPDLMFKLAKKNQVQIPYENIEEVKKAYNFSSLQSFLDIYYAGANILVTESDFFDLTWEYFLTCKAQNIVHVEIMFDPQTHTKRGVSFETIINGICKAQEKAKDELEISSFLIMSFLRHLSEEEAFVTLKEAELFKGKIKAVGLDSSEVGNPPSKFKRVFEKAREQGYKVVVHAGEEGDTSYIWESIELLKANRIDHGIRCDEDEKLLSFLNENQIPLTVCPLSNVKLKAVSSMSFHNIKKLLDFGLCVCVNSDDPAYFGGYLNKNFEALVDFLHVSKEDIKKLVINSFEASFLPISIKTKYINQIKKQ